MKFGLVVPNFCGGVRGAEVPSLSGVVDFSQKSERLGFDSLWVIDHLCVGWPIYSTTWLDPIVTLSALAPVTKTIKLGTSVIVLPLRIPPILAKEIASLDILSGGRVQFGVGNGWWDKEFEACGVPKKQRGARSSEGIDIILKLWKEESLTYEGKFYSFKDVSVVPKPIQKPHPPIWIAGGSAIGKAKDVYQIKADQVLKRVAKYGDVWLSRAYTDLDRLSADWKLVQQYLGEFGKSTSKFTFAHITWIYLTEGKSESAAKDMFARCLSIPFSDVKKEAIMGTKKEIIKQLEDLRGIGIQYNVLWPTHDDDELLNFLSKEVLPSFA
ncbi:MAG: LLM class flavin-dependent oxidoreductase [Nitrososphaerales archaeon]